MIFCGLCTQNCINTTKTLNMPNFNPPKIFFPTIRQKNCRKHILGNLTLAHELIGVRECNAEEALKRVRTNLRTKRTRSSSSQCDLFGKPLFVGETTP